MCSSSCFTHKETGTEKLSYWPNASQPVRMEAEIELRQPAAVGHPVNPTASMGHQEVGMKK